jgi:cytochrome b involved in lipid metabolism
LTSKNSIGILVRKLLTIEKLNIINEEEDCSSLTTSDDTGKDVALKAIIENKQHGLFTQESILEMLNKQVCSEENFSENASAQNVQTENSNYFNMIDSFIKEHPVAKESVFKKKYQVVKKFFKSYRLVRNNPEALDYLLKKFSKSLWEPYDELKVIYLINFSFCLSSNMLKIKKYWLMLILQK